MLTLASSRDLLATPLSADLFSLSTVETEAVATGIPLDGNDVHVRLWALVDNEWFHSDTTYGSIYSPGPLDYETECLERHWQKVSVDVQGESRDLLWREPDNGRWENGAIIVFHGGAGSSSNWCSDILITHAPDEFARAAAFAAVAAADPYGTYLYCAETPGQEQRPGIYGDVETYSPISAPGACAIDSYPNEREWETGRHVTYGRTSGSRNTTRKSWNFFKR